MDGVAELVVITDKVENRHLKDASDDFRRDVHDSGSGICDPGIFSAIKFFEKSGDRCPRVSVTGKFYCPTV